MSLPSRLPRRTPLRPCARSLQAISAPRLRPLWTPLPTPVGFSIEVSVQISVHQQLENTDNISFSFQISPIRIPLSSSSHDERRHNRHSRHNRHNRHSRSSFSSSSSSSSASSDDLSSLTITPPPQFVSPIYEFEKGERGDLAISFGDVIEVKRYVDKNWYKGINLTTRKKGIFPVAYVKEVEISSTKAIEPLSGRKRAASHSRIHDKKVVEMPKETERKGSFFYPTDTVIVRDRGNRTTRTGYHEIDQDVILIRPRDTINHEPARVVDPTVERDVVTIDRHSGRRHVEEDITIIKPHRAIKPPVVEEEKLVIPIRRKEISLRDLPLYANKTPEVDIERIHAHSRARNRSRDRAFVVEDPKRIVIERPREIEEAGSVITRRSRSQGGSIKQIRLQDLDYNSYRGGKKDYKVVPPPKTITYNEHGVPVFVDTKTFAPAPAMTPPPRPLYRRPALEPAPVSVLPAQRSHRVYQY
ncbi:LOW QUALITY PROTEIN: hypothetical protein Dda_4288 [Drechslerella dactyloides]|uniref:SH3 domain-containing protein n=1 Tax=Drechslerella dactyloides TaxID=74499 RepID=A0AAD6IZG7_DREDA|nr:LOW QUALITY PROTEIN: hypothetical protein Dda_4288 [Drechslerella dactyloides]